MSNKSEYDKLRYLKRKNGTWKYNPTPPSKLSDIQMQVLQGGLLGDSYLYHYKNQINSGLAISHTSFDEEYVKYKYNLYKDFCKSNIKYQCSFDKRTNKTYSKFYFRTQVSDIFTEFRNKWYPNGIKIVPKDIDLTPIVCAIWFCDDGSVIRYGKNKNRLRLQLATDGFQKEEVDFLAEKLSQIIGSACKVSRKINHYFIYASHETTVKFIKYIEPVFPYCMKRKSEKWEGLI